MAGLLSGLGKLGLKNLEGMNLYEEEKKGDESSSNAPKAAPVVQETDFLLDRTYECPVCDEQFKARGIKNGRARLIRTDMDLRPVYENIEPLKYDVVICPHCGYSALTRYFKSITSAQAKAIKEKISSSFQPMTEKKETYTYEEALDRYKLSLANAIVKSAKDSEKAYICLKSGWLLRSMRESLGKEEPDYDKKVAEIKEQEDEFLKNALEGFMSAMQKESYPMCGMDEGTVEFLIAVLAMYDGQYDVSSKLISNILASPASSNRMKDKARDVKEMLVVKIKEKKGGQ